MKRGPKPQTPATKLARGTYKPSRNGGASAAAARTAADATVAALARPALQGEVMDAGAVPAMPDYLSPGAQLIWQEELGRVMIGGVVERDSSLFATYCELEAACRKAWQGTKASRGTPATPPAPPPAAYLTELRRMRELLGIAGPRARASGGTKPNDQPSGNPFVRNRPR